MSFSPEKEKQDFIDQFALGMRQAQVGGMVQEVESDQPIEMDLFPPKISEEEGKKIELLKGKITVQLNAQDTGNSLVGFMEKVEQTLEKVTTNAAESQSLTLSPIELQILSTFVQYSNEKKVLNGLSFSPSVSSIPPSSAAAPIKINRINRIRIRSQRRKQNPDGVTKSKQEILQALNQPTTAQTTRGLYASFLAVLKRIGESRQAYVISQLLVILSSLVRIIYSTKLGKIFLFYCFYQAYQRNNTILVFIVNTIVWMIRKYSRIDDLLNRLPELLEETQKRVLNLLIPILTGPALSAFFSGIVRMTVLDPKILAQLTNQLAPDVAKNLLPIITQALENQGKEIVLNQGKNLLQQQFTTKLTTTLAESGIKYLLPAVAEYFLPGAGLPMIQNGAGRRRRRYRSKKRRARK